MAPYVVATLFVVNVLRTVGRRRSGPYRWHYGDLRRGAWLGLAATRTRRVAIWARKATLGLRVGAYMGAARRAATGTRRGVYGGANTRRVLRGPYARRAASGPQIASTFTLQNVGIIRV